jgi:AraC family transcriptional regulator
VRDRIVMFAIAPSCDRPACFRVDSGRARPNTTRVDLEEQVTMPYLRSDPSITPTTITRMLPTEPVWTAPPLGDGSMIAQFYRHPSARVEHSGLPAHCLVLGMGGQSFVTDTLPRGQRQAWCLPGCFSLTPAGQPLRRSWQGRPEALVVLLDQDLLVAIADELECRGPTRDLHPTLGARDPILHDLGRVMLRLLAEPGPETVLMMDALSRAIGVHLLRRYSGTEIASDIAPPSLSSVRMRRVVEYMAENLHRPIGLAELAAVCGLSRTHFGRAFRQASGRTPVGYLTWLRIERAKRLLVASRAPVSEIAESCGFGQAQYFATVFQRELGVTPTAWRREHGG